MSEKPVLVTFTSPSAAGKSYLLNYIREVAKLPCIVSTTTRVPRAGEREGVDYYFIDETISKMIEEADGFAELAIYRGARYGVTKKEFSEKLSRGIAFLILEPSGIDHYVKPAIDAGAIHLKYYLHTDFDVRLDRYKARVRNDVAQILKIGTIEQLMNCIDSSIDRLVSMTTTEMKWGDMCHWHRILFGKDNPAYNLQIILNDIKSARQSNE